MSKMENVIYTYTEFILEIRDQTVITTENHTVIIQYTSTHKLIYIYIYI